MVDRTPTNSLSIKMRAKHYDDLAKGVIPKLPEEAVGDIKKREQHYAGLKISQQKEEARGSMKKRDKRFKPVEASRIKYPYATNYKFIFEFGLKRTVQIKCSKISNLELSQEIEEYVEGGGPYPHILPTSKKRSEILRIERAVANDEILNKLKPGVRILYGNILIYRDDTGFEENYGSLVFYEGMITKCQFSDLDAMGSGIFIQTLEIAHSGLMGEFA